MIVATRCGGLPGNVRNRDGSFGLTTQQLNHHDSSILEEVSAEVLKQPVELLITLTFPTSNNDNDEIKSTSTTPTPTAAAAAAAVTASSSSTTAKPAAA
jgi:hypothetical protein